MDAVLCALLGLQLPVCAVCMNGCSVLLMRCEAVCVQFIPSVCSASFTWLCAECTSAALLGMLSCHGVVFCCDAQ